VTVLPQALVAVEDAVKDFAPVHDAKPVPVPADFS
jgi:hypothetical protein